MKWLAVLLVILFLLGCGTESLFSPAEDLYGINVISIAEGQTLEKGEWIHFEVNSTEGEASPSYLLITLYDSTGETIAVLTVEGEAMADDQPGVDLENLDLVTGYYEIEFSLYGEDVVLAQERIPFFYAIERYGIWSVEASLPVIYPGARVLLETDLMLPEEADPYIRWIQDSAVLASGTLSEGLDRIYWPAPEEEGIYSLSVEIFPVPPPQEMEFRLNSSITMDTELYVSSNVESENDLSPSDSYYSLFNLNGTLTDFGTSSGEEQRDAVEIGSLVPVVREGNVSFLIVSPAGFTVPRMILPVENGEIQPFSLSMGFMMESLAGGERLFHTASDDDAFALTIQIGDDLSPKAVVRFGSLEASIPSGVEPLLTDRRYLLTLSFLPADGELLWHLDGRERSRLDLVPESIDAGGKTTVGGPGGFDGLLDELAVYHRDERNLPSADLTLFHTVMQQKFADALVFADGFDGAGVLDVEEAEIVGDAVVERGSLILSPASALLIDVPADKEIFVSVELPEPIRVYTVQKENVLSIIPLEKPQGEEPSGLLFPTEEDWRLPIQNSESSVDTIRIAAAESRTLTLDSLLVYAE